MYLESTAPWPLPSGGLSRGSKTEALGEHLAQPAYPLGRAGAAVGKTKRGKDTKLMLLTDGIWFLRNHAFKCGLHFC